MAFINYLTQIQLDFGTIALLPQECERIGIRKPLVVTDACCRCARQGTHRARRCTA